MTSLRQRLKRRTNDRGSMAVEFVVAAPALVLLLLLVAAGGQWLNLTGKVGSATRDAVRSASLARTFADAQDNAQAAAQTDLAGVCSGGGQGTPATKVQLFTNGVRVGPGDFAVAQDIEVTVSCVANLAAFHVIGFPVSQTFGDTAAAPLDPFVDRG
ncbi:MAG TPA: TadE/TadG family type IV pilus assembly protein [Streptosporangiaceae bacterium]|jgi:Flp pilus assembly protein TadG|nr:TadE/TadG family type IV pilus assembly protein [Streptosporangiaceae bacterium]